ncbi:MAG: hypothetical protein HQ518_24715 [Rhodopirellula sp.]|nr:hypothetical protein [Rhodopirellula sp.]
MPRIPLDRPYGGYWRPLWLSDSDDPILTPGFSMLCCVDQLIRKLTDIGIPSNAAAVDYLAFALAGESEFSRFAVDYHDLSSSASSDVRLDTMGTSQRWDLSRSVSTAIQHAAVAPKRPKQHRKSKGSGAGFRNINVYALQDQITQKVLSLIAGRIVDPNLPNELIGSRPRRDRVELITRLRDAVATGKTHLLRADLKNAFDNVPLGRLFEIAARSLPPQLCNTIHAALHPEPTSRGIPQGHAISPLLLNIYVAHVIVRRLCGEFPDVMIAVYVDDFIAAGSSHLRMVEFGERLQTLATAAGFSLKAPLSESHFDLTSIVEPVDALGYGFRVIDDELNTTIAPGGWCHLQDSLIALHDDVDAPFNSAEVIHGFITQNCPCLSEERQEQHVDTIVGCLESAGFDDWPDRVFVNRKYDEGMRRWKNQNAECSTSHVPFTAVEKFVLPDDELAGGEVDVEPPPTYFAFIYAWHPWPKNPLDDRGPRAGGWSWAITDPNYTLLSHGCGSAVVQQRDPLLLRCLDEVADTIEQDVPDDCKLELVVDSARFGRTIENGARPTCQADQDATLGTDDSSNSPAFHARSVARRLNARNFHVKVFSRHDIQRFDASDRGCMARTVRFWAKQAVREPSEDCAANAQ